MADSNQEQPMQVIEEKSFGDYTFTIESDADYIEQKFKIYKKGLLLYIKDGHRFRIGLVEEDLPEDKLVGMGQDITGDDEPDLVVSDWSGGAHCCFSYDVFSVGETFKHLAFLDGGHSIESLFKDVDGDKTLEFISNDWTFAYWNTSFALSPAPDMILKWNGRDYVPDMALMYKAGLNEKQYKKLFKGIENERNLMLKEIKRQKKKEFFDYQNFGWFRDGVFIPSLTWSHLLWLIYTGHAPDAKGILAKLWPKDKPGQEIFWKEFMEKFSDSPYCYAVRDYYGSRFPIDCNKQTDDFGTAGMLEIMNRDEYQEMIMEKESEQQKRDIVHETNKPCDGEIEDCS